MEVLMVASELAPHARATSAGDSIAALAKALRQLGHTVTVLLPRSAGFSGSGPLLARRLSPLSIEPGLEVTVLDGQLPSGVSLVLFDSPEFAAYAQSGTAADEGRRAVLLARAAAAFVRERREQGKAVDVVHVHDWSAASVAALLARDEAAPPVVLTIHQLGVERLFDEEALRGLGPALAEPRARVGQRISPLRIGMISARAVTTVSPGYAGHLQESALGEILPSLAEPVQGIVEGVDYATFNPATDSALNSRFDAEDVANKGRCKAALSRAAGLEISLERPLVCVPLTGTDSAGQSLLARALPRLLSQDVAVLVSGTPEAELEQALKELTQDYPGTVGRVADADDEALRRCLSAADFVLTARSDAPAGHLEMAAQRYGSLPIAAASGGTPDVVVDADPELETGTGFLYEAESLESLLGSVGRALAAFGDERFPSLRRRVMRRDLGWDRPARRYVQIYRRARGESVFS